MDGFFFKRKQTHFAFKLIFFFNFMRHLMYLYIVTRDIHNLIALTEYTSIKYIPIYY